jgi:methionine-gamma-lyase
MAGPGSLISFELKGGIEAGRELLKRVRLPALAVSLGGVESLIQHPGSMTHAGVSRAYRVAARITDGLVRLSAPHTESGGMDTSRTRILLDDSSVG